VSEPADSLRVVTPRACPPSSPLSHRPIQVSLSARLTGRPPGCQGNSASALPRLSSSICLAAAIGSRGVESKRARLTLEPPLLPRMQAPPGFRSAAGTYPGSPRWRGSRAAWFVPLEAGASSASSGTFQPRNLDVRKHFRRLEREVSPAARPSSGSPAPGRGPFGWREIAGSRRAARHPRASPARVPRGTGTATGAGAGGSGAPRQADEGVGLTRELRRLLR
jgi:hypothetical protein